MSCRAQSKQLYRSNPLQLGLLVQEASTATGMTFFIILRHPSITFNDR